MFVTYDWRPIVGVHTDGGSWGAGYPGDGVQRLADVDVEVWRSVILVHCLIWKKRIVKRKHGWISPSLLGDT